MSNITFTFDAEERVIDFHQDERHYDPDCEDDVDVYIHCVLSPPPGILVRGDAVDYGLRKIIAYRGLPEFLTAFSHLHPDEHCIDFLFAHACEKCNLDVARHLLTLGADINGDGPDHAMSFMLAVASHQPNEELEPHYNVMRFLLSFENIDITKEDGNGSPWFQVLERNYPLDIIELFIQRGADVQSTTDMSTPLTISMEFGNIETVRLLLRHGADPNVCDESGRLPLTYAAMQNSMEGVQLLLLGGANPCLPDRRGKLPRSYSNNPNVIAALDSWTTVNYVYCFQSLGLNLEADLIADIASAFAIQPDLNQDASEDEDEDM